MKLEKNKIVFGSGRERYCNHGIVGLSPRLNVSEGYDGGFWDGFESEEWRESDEQLTAEDLNELADHMIERWQEFKKRLAERR